MLREALMKRAQEEEEAGGDPEGVEMIDALADFLVENPDPDDEAVHAFAEQHGWEPDDLEAQAYRLATIAARFVTGGKAAEKGIDFEDVDQEQLAMGIEVEKEHTPCEATASRIALDHLAEIPDYYTRLKAMEDEAKAAQGE